MSFIKFKDPKTNKERAINFSIVNDVHIDSALSTLTITFTNGKQVTAQGVYAQEIHALIKSDLSFIEGSDKTGLSRLFINTSSIIEWKCSHIVPGERSVPFVSIRTLGGTKLESKNSTEAQEWYERLSSL